MILQRPPLGVLPRWLWLEQLELPDQPSPEELTQRRADVLAAIERYRQAGLVPLTVWLLEI